MGSEPASELEASIVLVMELDLEYAVDMELGRTVAVAGQPDIAVEVDMEDDTAALLELTVRVLVKAVSIAFLEVASKPL